MRYENWDFLSVFGVSVYFGGFLRARNVGMENPWCSWNLLGVFKKAQRNERVWTAILALVALQINNDAPMPIPRTFWNLSFTSKNVLCENGVPCTLHVLSCIYSAKSKRGWREGDGKKKRHDNLRQFTTFCDVLWQFPSLYPIDIKRHKTS